MASTTFATPPDPQSNSFIGTDLSGTPLIADVDLAGVGEDIVAATGRSLEDLAASGELFDALASVLGEDAVAAALPSAWRTVLYDDHHATYAGTPDYFPLKRFIFDATDERYSAYADVRPEGGPTLRFLYDMAYTESDGDVVWPFQAVIDDTLLRMLESEDPEVTLDAPWGTSVPSLFPSRFLNGSATDRTFDEWTNDLATEEIQYNGAFYTRDRIPLNADQIAAARAALDGEELALFETMVGDDVVNVADLRDAGLDAALEALWVYFGGR